MRLTRQDASSNGENYYYTGKPCKYGHYSKRLTASGNCHECWKDWRKGSKSIKASHMRRHTNVNNATRKRAVNAGGSLTIREIDIATSRTEEGRYVLSAYEAASKLGRSYRSIEHIRRRFRDGIISNE